MRKFYFPIVLLAILFTGCSSSDEPIPEPDGEQSSNSYFEFNKWVYSAMNRQYLWREDLPDSLDCDYELAPRDFFYSLLSDKDRFSYFTNNPYYDGGGTQKAPDADPGFAYQRCRDASGREALQVLYVTSPDIKRAGIRRGDFVRILSLAPSRVSLQRIDCRESAFYENGNPVEITIDEIEGKKSTVLCDSIYEVTGKKVGYMCYLEYDDTDDLIEPLRKFKAAGIDDLILDLRYNPGGYVSTCRFLSNCIAPAKAYGGIFQQCSYNSILAEEYEAETGNERTFSYYDTPFSTDDMLGVAEIIPLQLPRLYVITSKHTASASEATVICLRPYMDITLIGETTVGKGVGSWTIYDRRFRYAIQPITMRYYNSYGETTPDEGLEPDYFIADGYSVSRKEIGDTSEPLLNEALRIVGPGSMPPTYAGRRSRMDTRRITPVGAPSFVESFQRRHGGI